LFTPAREGVLIILQGKIIGKREGILEGKGRESEKKGGEKLILRSEGCNLKIAPQGRETTTTEITRGLKSEREKGAIHRGDKTEASQCQENPLSHGTQGKKGS